MIFIIFTDVECLTKKS